MPIRSARVCAASLLLFAGIPLGAAAQPDSKIDPQFYFGFGLGKADHDGKPALDRLTDEQFGAAYNTLQYQSSVNRRISTREFTVGVNINRYFAFEFNLQKFGSVTYSARGTAQNGGPAVSLSTDIKEEVHSYGFSGVARTAEFGRFTPYVRAGLSRSDYDFSGYGLAGERRPLEPPLWEHNATYQSGTAWGGVGVQYRGTDVLSLRAEWQYQPVLDTLHDIEPVKGVLIELLLTL